MEQHYDVIVVGNYTIDLVFTGLPRFPVLGEDTIGTGFDLIPGEAYNSAVALHRLGLRVGWAADFGNDRLSRLALEFLRQEGLDETLLVHHDRPLRRISAAASFPEERGFMTYYDPDPTPPAAVQALLTASAHVMYVPGLYYGPDYEAFLPLVQAKGMKIIMDGNSDSQSTLGDLAVRRAIENSAVFLPNAREACRLAGKQELEEAIEVLALVGPALAVKAGAQGAYSWAAGKIIHEPAIQVTPLDTTGAGDIFSAGFVKAWLDNRPLRECLRWGNIAGGLSTLKHGGTGCMVTCKEIEDHLMNHPKSNDTPDDRMERS